MVSGVFPGSCPFLVEHLTVFIPVIGGVLFVFVVVSLLQTSLTDPGILPRATPDEAADVERQIGRTGFWRCLLGTQMGREGVYLLNSWPDGTDSRGPFSGPK